MIDDWQKRVQDESYDLPDIIEITPTNFTSTIATADRVDSGVAGYMGAALLFVSKAVSDIRAMRYKNPSDYPDSPMAMGVTTETRTGDDRNEQA